MKKIFIIIILCLATVTGWCQFKLPPSVRTIKVQADTINLPTTNIFSPVFTDNRNNLTTNGIGTSSQFVKADGSLDGRAYQIALTLTTTGASGAATLSNGILNIPNYITNGDNYSTSATPSISAGAGMGTGGGTILINGSNQDGVITFTTGTSPAASSIIVTITLSGSPYPNSPVPVITPGSSTGSLAGCSVVGVGVNTNSWSINSGTTPLAANTSYTFYYHCGGY